ncbi:MAG: hypothetical protein ACXWP0_19230 [Ktedonobacterales bacterium]
MMRHRTRTRILSGIVVVGVGLTAMWRVVQRGGPLPPQPSHAAQSPDHPPGPGEGADELNAVTYAERLKRTFPGIYLTLISIVQGVAVYTLSYVTTLYWGKGATSAWLSYVPFSLTSFVVIVVVTFEYTWFVALFHWQPRVLDVTIPLALGLFEILPMYYFDSPIWWRLFTAFLCLGGAAAYAYPWYNLAQVEIHPAYRDAYRAVFRSYYIWNISACLICAALLSLQAFVARDSTFVFQTHAFVLQIAAWGPLLVLEIFIVVRSRRLLTRLGQIFGQQASDRNKPVHAPQAE